jgi:hypothetical protein
MRPEPHPPLLASLMDFIRSCKERWQRNEVAPSKDGGVGSKWQEDLQWSRWILITLMDDASILLHICQAMISLRPTEILKTVYQAHDDGPASSIKVIRLLLNLYLTLKDQSFRSLHFVNGAP